MNRILWNERDDDTNNGDIDEIVLHDVACVHVEQMNNRCWWIGITCNDGTEWSGNFYANSRGVMRFMEQDSTIEWESDQEHLRARLEAEVIGDPDT